MNILLIDDDAALLTIFSTALQKAGYTTTTASDGQSGIEKAQQSSFDLILIDQILPDMRGNDILKQLKSEEKTKGTPLLLLSNFGQTELIQEAMNLGAADYILKYQIEPADLVAKVQEILKGNKPVEENMPEDPMVGQN